MLFLTRHFKNYLKGGLIDRVLRYRKAINRVMFYVLVVLEWSLHVYVCAVQIFGLVGIVALDVLNRPDW